MRHLQLSALALVLAAACSKPPPPPPPAPNGLGVTLLELQTAWNARADALAGGRPPEQQAEAKKAVSRLKLNDVPVTHGPSEDTFEARLSDIVVTGRVCRENGMVQSVSIFDADHVGGASRTAFDFLYNAINPNATGAAEDDVIRALPIAPGTTQTFTQGAFNFVAAETNEPEKALTVTVTAATPAPG